MKKELKFIIGIVLCLILIVGIVSYTYENNVNLVVGIGILVVSALLIPELYKKEIKEENLFLMIAPIILLFFLITIPSWKNPDEPMHWRRIYDIMQGNLIVKTVDGVAISKMPESVVNYIDETYYNELDINYNRFKELYEKKISKDDEKVNVSLETTAVYCPIVYFPQAIAGKIVDIFTDRPFLIMYGARIGNIIFSILILFLAIKIIPYGKKILILLSFLPVAAAGYASMSPDAMTISVSYLFISYILKLTNEKDKKIKWKDKLILGILAIVVSLCKIVYLPLVGLILLLPKNKYNNRKEQVLTCLGVMGISIVLNLIWLNFSSKYLIEYKRRSTRN